LVRKFVRANYIEGARRRGDSVIQVVAGDVHRALGFKNRVPSVCQALASRQFMEENDVALEHREGPPSGLSTTVVFTYRLNPEREKVTREGAFHNLRGIAKTVFAELGGGESFIRTERDRFQSRE
jgi:hypothetical protein